MKTRAERRKTWIANMTKTKAERIARVQGALAKRDEPVLSQLELEAAQRLRKKMEESDDRTTSVQRTN